MTFHTLTVTTCNRRYLLSILKKKRFNDSRVLEARFRLWLFVLSFKVQPFVPGRCGTKTVTVTPCPPSVHTRYWKQQHGLLRRIIIIIIIINIFFFLVCEACAFALPEGRAMIPCNPPLFCRLLSFSLRSLRLLYNTRNGNAAPRSSSGPPRKGSLYSEKRPVRLLIK